MRGKNGKDFILPLIKQSPGVASAVGAAAVPAGVPALRLWLDSLLGPSRERERHIRTAGCVFQANSAHSSSGRQPRGPVCSWGFC